MAHQWLHHKFRRGAHAVIFLQLSTSFKTDEKATGHLFHTVQCEMLTDFMALFTEVADVGPFIANV